MQAPPKEMLLSQTEHYVEYSRTGQVVKGQEPAVPRSKYEEDGTSPQQGAGAELMAKGRGTGTGDRGAGPSDYDAGLGGVLGPWAASPSAWNGLPRFR